MTSQGARGGFSNERDAISKINLFDLDARKWVAAMGYSVDQVEEIKAKKADHGIKPDIVVSIKLKNSETRHIERISAKLASQSRGFNQIDRGRVIDRYKRLWGWLSDDASTALRLFTGDIEPRPGSRDPRRMFADELETAELEVILNTFRANKLQMFETIFAGSPPNRADWFLGHDLSSDKWFVCTMDFAIAFYSDGPVELTPRGSFRIGKITAQRKGGDGGAETAKHLQFKFDPNEISTAIL